MSVVVPAWMKRNQRANLERSVLRRELADLCHEQWSGWMRYLFQFGIQNEDGTFTMDADKVARWRRQMNTPYRDLTEPEQDSDRQEADKFLALMST